MTTPPALAAITTPAYSVVIPCYNERDNIIALADEVRTACGSDDFEIVVVDDRSTDDTLAQLQAAQPRFDGRLRVVRHGVNSGQSAGVCSGVDHARGRWIITLDGDGQNDPADIPRLLAVLRQAPAEPALIVCGYRRQRRDTVIRRLSSRVANAVRSAVLKDATPDTGCGLKALERTLFMRLPRFNHMHRFLPALVQRAGGQSVSVEVHHRPRLHGQSKYGISNRLWVGIIDLFGVMWLIRRRFKPSRNEEV